MDDPVTLSLAEVMAGTERAERIIATWPQWMRDLSPGTVGDRLVDRRLYWDLDGVLVNWTKAMARLFGVDLDVAYEANRNGKFADVLGMSKSAMWRTVASAGADLWSDMEALEDAWDLFMESRRVLGPDRVVILTSPTFHHSCYAGKAKWVQDRIGADTECINISREKWQFAGPNRWLIDDTGVNCDEWVNHPDAIPGGQVILMPRYGHIDRPAALDRIRHILELAA